uniref:Uncharacterized protein n=1 Tax=Panagrolaimus superbus TaxID=310955 RepID=A0A914ZA28_9BILA
MDQPDFQSNFYLVYPNEKHPNFESTVIERSRSIYYFSKGSVIRFFILIFATIFPFYLFTKILKKFQYATVESEVHLYKLSHRINQFEPRILKYKQALNKLDAEEIFYKKKIAIMARDLGFDIPEWYWDPHYWDEIREHRKKHIKIHKEFLQVMAGKIQPPQGWYPEYLRTDLFPDRKEGDEEVTKKSKKIIDKTQINTVE